MARPAHQPDNENSRTAAARGWLVREPDGRPAVREWWNGFSTVLDLTSPDADGGPSTPTTKTEAWARLAPEHPFDELRACGSRAVSRSPSACATSTRPGVRTGSAR
ncbi:MAG: hypothetical protein ACRYG2_10010 [Janthinobacterium lividum]